MKKRFVIVSTYPEHGSCNVGDQLITDSLTKVILDMCDAEITTVWRADNWENVCEDVTKADHVFFACLAIRPNMEIDIYPYLKNVITSRVPVSVIASGTDLPVATSGGIYRQLSSTTCELLRQLSERSVVFTTRGALTQELCKKIGIDRARLDGDVAFYDRRFKNRCFCVGTDIRNILISDPHYGSSYFPALEVVWEGVKELFPEAKISLVQHGINDAVSGFCSARGISPIRIYEDKHNGLDIYDLTDLHVGFRVHGHVSALMRRKFSYLLEQDGRGCDYGLTLSPKISIPNYTAFVTPECSLKGLLKKTLRRPFGKKVVSTAPAEQLVALLRNDYDQKFVKFEGLENQIEHYNERVLSSVKKALAV